jgi:hypothetical protein
MLTPNLHYAACRAFKQETAQGPLANRNELWVEQRVGQEKNATAGRVTKEPERTVAEKRCMKQALAIISGRGEIRPMTEWHNTLQPRCASYMTIPDMCMPQKVILANWHALAKIFHLLSVYGFLFISSCRDNTAGSKWDDGDEFCTLLGAGQQISSQHLEEGELAVLVTHLGTIARAQQEVGWEAADLIADTTTISRYHRASKVGVGLIDSHLYGKARSKKSFYALIEYEVGHTNKREYWVAKIAYFLKVSGEGKDDLRLAVGNLFTKPITQIGQVYKVKEGKFYSDQEMVFTFTSIVCTLVSCGVEDTRAKDKRGPRCTPWFDKKDAGSVYLIRSANTSRF